MIVEIGKGVLVAERYCTGVVLRETKKAEVMTQFGGCCGTVGLNE
jgi:hypothetical protein